MGSTDGLDGVSNRITGGNSGTPEFIPIWKGDRVASAAAVATILGRWTSLWQYEGQPSHGAAPGAVAAPTNATSGNMWQTDPGGGRQKWLVGAGGVASVQGTLILYDRLLHISGLDGTNTGAQTVGGSLTRYTSGVGNQIWVEVYTQIGATARTITASYTDQGGAASTSPAVAIGGIGLREAQRIIPLTIDAADTGVQGVTSVTLSASTGTAGDFGITVAHPLAIYPVPVACLGSPHVMEALQRSMIEVQTGACLALAWVPSGTTAPAVNFNLCFIED